MAWDTSGKSSFKSLRVGTLQVSHTTPRMALAQPTQGVGTVLRHSFPTSFRRSLSLILLECAAAMMLHAFQTPN